VSVLAWIGLGVLGGLACGWFLQSRGRALLGDVAAGVLGAIIGGFMAAVLLGLDIADLDGTSTLVAVMGAALVILILHTLPTVDVFE
jgi:uncharacterized membrane protein YeaQ/YmgE (transglycosylase-associated protein family)